MYSAEIAGDEEDEKEAAKNATLTEEELSAKKAKEAKQFQWLLYITVAISIVVSVALLCCFRMHWQAFCARLVLLK